MNFKTGDKIRYIGIPAREFTVGKVYRVTKSDADGFWITTDDGREEGLWHTCKSFECVDEPIRFTKDSVYEVFGCEMVQTTEEKLVKYYREREKWARQAFAAGGKHRYDVNMAQVQAINATLSILGITVKGIND